MNKPHPMLYDQVPPEGGTGGGYDFRNDLPEDIRKDPVFDSIKVKDAKEALATLGKGYVHAQRTIGMRRLEAPNKDWSPEKWSEFNKALGVPDKPEEYGTPEFKFRDGVKILPEKLDGYKKLFKEIGLRPDQAARLQAEYFKDIDSTYGQYESERSTAQNKALATLKERYGDDFDSKIDIGKSVIKKFGSEALLEQLTESGMINNPDVVDFIVKMGENLLEDRPAGEGSGLPIGTRARATQEIASLKMDSEFQKAMNDRNNPGHKAAVEKWLGLHKQAYPDKMVEA